MGKGGRRTTGRKSSGGGSNGGGRTNGPPPHLVAQVEKAVSAVFSREVPAGPLPVVEPKGPSLEECLAQVQELMGVAEAQRLETETALAQARTARERAEKMRREVDSELAARRKELDRLEERLEQERRDLADRSCALQKEGNALREREVALVERAADLAAREGEAAEGFLAERLRILGPVEGQIAALESTRRKLTVELAEARAQAASEHEEARMQVQVQRAEALAKLDKEIADQRRRLDDQLGIERRDALASLREELRREREDAEAAWAAERQKAEGLLEACQQSLDVRAVELSSQDRELRQARRAVEVAQEELDEQKEALDAKVQRLLARDTEKLRHELDTVQRQLADARSTRDAYFAEIESLRALNQQFGDKSPTDVLQALRDAERRAAELSQQLRQRPDERAAERLAELEQQRSQWLDERAALKGELANARSELGGKRIAAIDLESLRREKEALAAQNQILVGALDELKGRVDELTRQDDRRNPMTALAELDGDEDLQAEMRTIEPLGRGTPDLAAFADDLKHRIARGIKDRTLYYTDRDIRSFLGGLAMTRLLLLQGISGTGKTSLPLAFASAVDGGHEVIEVQAGWRDRQDLLGYYNAFHRHYYATNFLQALYRAGAPSFRDRPVLIVLDEINLSRPEQFFADFLSALEQPTDARRITLLNDPLADAPKLMVEGRHLPIPPNVWFVGTANHDETTAAFADKTYDRAHVMEMPRKTEDAQFEVLDKRARRPISFGGLERAFADAQREHTDAVAHATGWLRREEFVEKLGKRFRVGWGNRLEQQLSRYLPVVVAAGGSVGEAVDHLLETKVMRKLRDRHDVRAPDLEQLQKDLLDAGDRLDKANPLERCDALIEREIAEKKGGDLL